MDAVDVRLVVPLFGFALAGFMVLHALMGRWTDGMGEPRRRE